MAFHLNVNIRSCEGNKGIGHSDKVRAISALMKNILERENGETIFRIADGTKYKLHWRWFND